MNLSGICAMLRYFQNDRLSDSHIKVSVYILDTKHLKLHFHNHFVVGKCDTSDLVAQCHSGQWKVPVWGWDTESQTGDTNAFWQKGMLLYGDRGTGPNLTRQRSFWRKEKSGIQGRHRVLKLHPLTWRLTFDMPYPSICTFASRIKLLT